MAILKHEAGPKHEEPILACEITWMFSSYVYLMLPAFFLYILAWTLSELFVQICKEMERAFTDGGDVGRIVQESGVRHSLVCKAVWNLGGYFKNIILVNIVHIFVGSIVACFAILSRIKQGNFATAVSYSFLLLLRFVLLDAIGHFAERLKDKVHFLANWPCKLFVSLVNIFHVKG